MSKAIGKHTCTQCSYSSKRRYDLKKHFSIKHGEGQSHGRESSPERTTPNHTAVQSIITRVPGNAEKGQQKALRKRCTIQHYVSSDPDSSESESAIFISRPSHSSTPIDKPKTETTKIGFNLNGDSKKKKIVHLSVISSRSSESVNFVSKRATNALTGEEVESYMYVKDAKKCKGSLVESYLNDQVPEEQTNIDLEERHIIQEAIRSGTAPWNRSRIMIIGPAGVGKTSLIRRLTGQKFNPKEKSTKGAEQNVVTNDAVSSWKLENGAQTGKDDIMQSIAAMEPNLRSHSPCSTGGEENRNYPEITGSNRSTLGKGGMSETTEDEEDRNIAAISQGITQKEITKVKSTKLGITYSMWDFGGQEIYYITHPLFLSWRSLYILVIPLHLELGDKAPREEDAESGQEQLKGSAVRTRTILELVHFWLMSVYTHAVTDSHLEPKVLLIGTFAGDGGPGIIEEKATDKFKKLKERLGSYPYWKQVLSPMCAIDNQLSQPSEVKKIQDRIDGLVKDSAYMKVLMPIKWRTFTTEIEDSDQNTLKVTEAHSIMKRWGINDLKEVKAVLKFYHDIGHLIYHQGCELVVLKPQFLNSIVSNIITVIDDKKMGGDPTKCWKYLKEEGVLTLALIQAVWKEHNGDPDQLNNIISMMIMFDLICEIPERSDERRFFVPCRSSPKLHRKERHGKDDKVKFTIDFNHFLPDGFLHRFYVRMAKWSMERKEDSEPIFHCRQMMFYIDNRHRVVMKNRIHGKEPHQIKVTIYAAAPYAAPPERTKASVSLHENIIDHLHDTLEDLKNRWARRIEYCVGKVCPNCSELIPIRKILKDQDENTSCNIGCPVYVGDILKAFNKGKQLSLKDQGDSRSSMKKNTAINYSGYSHGSEDDSLSEPSTKRDKKTKRKTDSSVEDGRTRRGKQKKSHGSKDESMGEPSTKRDNKTNPKTDSTIDEDETRRDKLTMSDGSKDDSPDERPRKRKKKKNRQTDSGDEDGRTRGDKQTLEVSDAMLTKLARYIPSYAYDTFSEKLGIGLNQARNIVVMYNNNYEKATRDCMAKWRDVSTRSVADLHDVLREAELGGLIVHCN